MFATASKEPIKTAQLCSLRVPPKRSLPSDVADSGASRGRSSLRPLALHIAVRTTENSQPPAPRDYHLERIPFCVHVAPCILHATRFSASAPRKPSTTSCRAHGFQERRHFLLPPRLEGIAASGRLYGSHALTPRK